MSLTAFVRMGGQLLGKGIVVAAYCGDELRGKDTLMDDGAYTDILYLDIYGDTKGDKLHFKVFTEGRVIEVDQGLTYTSDDIIGSPESPYYIDLPTPVTTTFSLEGWATVCLPFDAEVPKGVSVLNATAVKDGLLETEALQLSTIHSPLGEGAEIGILPKGTPVLLEYAGAGPAPAQGQTPVTCEWLSRVVTDRSSLTAPKSSLLKGTTEPTAVDANKVLTLGHSKETGEIGFWLFTGTEIPANRAYIADFPAGARGFTFKFGDITSISENAGEDPVSARSSAAVYDLRGRRLHTEADTSHSSLKKGIYVMQGRKIVIK